MKFNKKSIRKTIANIDRYFTYDSREITGNTFRAIELNLDDDGYNPKTVAFRPFDFEGNYWFYYKNNGRTYTKIIKTYQDLNELNKLIKVMF